MCRCYANCKGSTKMLPLFERILHVKTLIFNIGDDMYVPKPDNLSVNI
jgi:hypothetical protein